MCKKIFFVVSFLAVFGFIFNFGAPTAKAMTAAEIQALIQSLQQQITQLQQQIAQLQQQLAEVEETLVVWCHNFNVNLRIGDTGDEVRALQMALQKEGLFSIRQDLPPYEFDERTASAVVGFQERYKGDVLAPWGLKYGTGFVGKSIRAKLNALYGCGINLPPPELCAQVITPAKNPITGECRKFSTPCDVPAGWDKTATCDVPIATTTPSITVTSPNGGEKWVMGQTYPIKWTSAGITKNVNIGMYQVGLDGEQLGGSDIATVADSLGYYNWKVPTAGYQSANWKILIFQPLNEVSPGATEASDESDSYFSIISSVTPSITVVSPSAGASWSQGGTYEIRWKAEGLNTVSINLIDYTATTARFGQQYGIASNVNAAQGYYSWKIPSTIPSGSWYKVVVGYEGTNAFSGFFSIAAAATPPVTFCDSYGDINQDGTVNANDSLYISQYVAGQKTLTDEQKLRADVNQDGQINSTDANQISEYLADSRTSLAACSKTPPCSSYGDINGNDYVNLRDSDLVNKNLVGSTTLTDAQKTKADVDGNGAVNINDSLIIGQYVTGQTSTFSVCTAPVPSITVTSPNGGEKLTGGQTYTIKWESQNVEKVLIKLCALTPLLEKGYTCHTLSGIPDAGITSSGSFSWKIDPNDPFIPCNNACKIEIYEVRNGVVSEVFDASDNYFSIASATTPQLISPSGDINTLTPTLKWNAVSGANWYVPVVLTVNGDVVTSIETKTTQADVPSGRLSWDREYNWKAIACESIEVDLTHPNWLNATSVPGCGHWSDIWSFTTIKPAGKSITVISPNGGET